MPLSKWTPERIAELETVKNLSRKEISIHLSEVFGERITVHAVSSQLTTMRNLKRNVSKLELK